MGRELAGTLHQGLSYLAETATVPPVADPESLFLRLIDLRLRRDLKTLGVMLTHRAHVTEIDPQTLRGEIEAATEEMWFAERRAPPHPIEQVVQHSVLRLCEAFQTKQTVGRRPTGIRRLDQLFLGWPAVGLTLLSTGADVDPFSLAAALVAFQPATGEQTLLVSDPVSKEDMVLRIVCHLAGVPLRNALSGYFD